MFSQFLSTLSLRRATCNMHSLRYCCTNFYPRSPCGERLQQRLPPTWQPYFYPRSPCGEQRKTQRNPTKPRDFYPRSPCGERHMDNLFRISYRNISIHALLAESDLGFCCCLFGGLVFLSTLSLRRATRPWWKCRAFRLYFYPRSPCGERHINTDSFSRVMLFLSTLSLRRATSYTSAGCGRIAISIHALLAESDRRLRT